MSMRRILSEREKNVGIGWRLVGKRRVRRMPLKGKRQIAGDLFASGKIEEKPVEGREMEKEKARINCKNCGQEFEPTCHSKECRYAYNNAKRHYAGMPLDICPGCGDVVEQTGERGRRRRFCSDRCRVRYWQEKCVNANRKMSISAGMECHFSAVSMRWVCSLDYPLLAGLKPVKS